MILLTAWHNPWPASMETMKASPHIRCDWAGRDWAEQMGRLHGANGIEPGKALAMGNLTPEQMAQVYSLSDVGLFPNRCEGGTNLVLMEYMACGKPAIVTDATGHKDLCHAGNAFLLRDLHPLAINDEKGRLAARWVEPSLAEIIASVEYVYAHRVEARARAAAAAEEMRQWTWRRTAETVVSTMRSL
jgi:glycosyltransferase involved in cell wall biosynthesis